MQYLDKCSILYTHFLHLAFFTLQYILDISIVVYGDFPHTFL